MEDLNVVDSINGAGTWLVRNQALLLSYAVNIVAAIAIIIIGLIVARVISNTVNRLMRARHMMRQWPTFFLRWCAMGLSLLR